MRHPSACALVIVTSLLMAGGCGGQSSEQPAEPATDAPAPAHQAAEPLSGTVLESIDAGPYTYVRVDTDSGEIWAAAPKVAVEVGQQVTVPAGMPMANFHSETLDRTFELVYFVGSLGAPGAAPGQMPPGHPEVGAAKPATEMDLSGIEPAKGGVTIAALYESRSERGGTEVAVRGKVVKVNLGIMGRNWLHLQDGTGDAKAGTNDLTVTTDGTAAVGDTVTVTGTVSVDKDFGAGYRYALIVEGATVSFE